MVARSSFSFCRTTGGEQAAKSLPACRSGYLVCRDVQGTSLFLFAAFNFLIEISLHSLHFLTGHFFRFRRVCVHGASVLEIIWDYPLFPEASEILRNSFRIFSSSRLALRARLPAALFPVSFCRCPSASRASLRSRMFCSIIFIGIVV